MWKVDNLPFCLSLSFVHFKMYFRLELPATTWHAILMVTVTQSLERNKDWLIAKTLLLARFVKHKTDLAGPDWFCIRSDLCGFDQKLDALSSKVGILHRFKLSHVCPQCARALARPIKRMIVHFLRIENIKLMYLVKYLLKQRSGKGRRVAIDIEFTRRYAV